MQGLDVIIQTGISVTFLLQYYGIGLLYGRNPEPVLKLYKRMVLCFIVVTGSRTVDLLVSSWLFNVSIAHFSRLFTMYEGESAFITGNYITGLYLALKLLYNVINPGWFLLFFPSIIIALICREGIPISRLQLRLKNLTLAVGCLCVVFYAAFPLLQTLNDLGFLAERSFFARLLAFSYQFVTVIFFTMYVFFCRMGGSCMQGTSLDSFSLYSKDILSRYAHCRLYLRMDIYELYTNVTAWLRYSGQSFSRISKQIGSLSFLRRFNVVRFICRRRIVRTASSSAAAL